MKDEVWINGERADVSDGTLIAITKQIDDIMKPGSFQSHYTNKFIIPATPHNNRLLGYSALFNNDGVMAYSNIDFVIKKDGIELIRNGKALIDEAGENYKISVVSGNADFFEDIKDLKLGDLDLSDYDHDWTRANIVASVGNDYTDGYIWPVIDWIHTRIWGSTLYGFKWDGGVASWVINCKTMFPAMFVRTLISEIATQAGWNLTLASVMEADFFSKTMIPFCNKPGTYDDEPVHTATLGWGHEFVMADHAPDITQAEFLKGIANMFGLVFVVDEKTHTLVFYALDEILLNYSNAYDWSDKIDDTYKPVFKYTLPGLAQTNVVEFIFPDDLLWRDKDDYNMLFTSIHTGMPDRATMISLPFSMSIQAWDDLAPAPYVPAVPAIYDVINLDTTPTINWGTNSGPRILELLESSSVTVRFHEGNLGAAYTDVASDVPWSYFYNSYYDDLGGTDMVDNYHKLMTKVLNRPMIITQRFILGYADIHNFNHMYPVYIKKYAAYFYVNKIKNYTGRGSTEVELIKI